MPKTVNAIIIPADHNLPVIQTALTPTLDVAQVIVGGYIEGLPSLDGWVAYGNEEAKLQGLPVNARAHLALVDIAGHDPADHLRGNVLIIGQDDDGEWANVPARIWQRLGTVSGIEI